MKENKTIIIIIIIIPATKLRTLITQAVTQGNSKL